MSYSEAVGLPSQDVVLRHGRFEVLSRYALGCDDEGGAGGGFHHSNPCLHLENEAPVQFCDPGNGRFILVRNILLIHDYLPLFTIIHGYAHGSRTAVGQEADVPRLPADFPRLWSTSCHVRPG
jgi:hypothetical protein